MWFPRQFLKAVSVLTEGTGFIMEKSKGRLILKNKPDRTTDAEPDIPLLSPPTTQQRESYNCYDWSIQHSSIFVTISFNK